MFVLLVLVQELGGGPKYRTVGSGCELLPYNGEDITKNT